MIINIIKTLVDEYGVPKSYLAKFLGVSRPTLDSRYNGSELKESERISIISKWGGLLSDKTKD